MKKKNLLNFLMVLIIVLIVFSGFMAVRNVKGTKNTVEFENSENITEVVVKENQKETKNVIPMYVHQKIGIVTVERNGIAYEVDDTTEVRTGDVYRTKTGSQIAFAEHDKNAIVVGPNSEIKVTDAENMCLELKEGEIFVDRRNTDKSMIITTEGASFTPKGTTYTITAYSSSYTVYVYDGEVSANGTMLKEDITASAGEVLLALKDADGNVTANVNDLNANSLSDSQIELLLACGMDSSFCFNAQQLNGVKKSREDEKAAAQQELLLLEEQAKADFAKEQEEYKEKEEAYIKALESGALDASLEENGELSTGSTGSKYCTIEIRCNTILDNMGSLKSGKEGYVPSSGKILSTTKVSFDDGDTVFDVLKKVCSKSGIQLEYSWTPLYNSYYIEGIHNLYEFDCGSESGWMYKVNGWFPNYGCSSYTLKNGDTIVWCYTCKGLGADVGGSNF